MDQGVHTSSTSLETVTYGSTNQLLNDTRHYHSYSPFSAPLAHILDGPYHFALQLLQLLISFLVLRYPSLHHQSYKNEFSSLQSSLLKNLKEGQMLPIQINEPENSEASG